LWTLINKDPEYLKVIENLSTEDIKDIPEGDGKAVFIPMMTESERDAYLKDQEPIWKKFNQKLKEIIK
jgi:hypothetical protein